MNVILSIKPKYARLILNGEKRYEFRKSIFSERYIYEVYIYVTAPVKRIVGLFEIGAIIKDSPEGLWNKFGILSGMDEAEFFDYFKGIKIGFAIEIKHVEAFEAQYDPKELIPGFNPPQSFCYLRYPLVPECTTAKTISRQEYAYQNSSLQLVLTGTERSKLDEPSGFRKRHSLR